MCKVECQRYDGEYEDDVLVDEVDESSAGCVNERQDREEVQRRVDGVAPALRQKFGREAGSYQQHQDHAQGVKDEDHGVERVHYNKRRLIYIQF